MADSPSTSSNSARRPVPLSYEPSPQPHLTTCRFVGQLIMGFAATSAAIGVGSALAIVATTRAGFLLSILITIFLLAWLVEWTCQQPRRRALFLGAAIAFGVALLVGLGYAMRTRL